MNAQPIHDFLTGLEKRRKALGMPWEALVARSGVSRATLCRVLKGESGAAFATVIAVAQALGVPVEFDGVTLRSRPIRVDAFLKQQAERQARKLVGIVQGSMGLEAQALPRRDAAPLIQRTKRRLLQGSKAKLWYE